MGGIWDLVTREVAFILQVVSVYILTMEMDTLMLKFCVYFSLQNVHNLPPTYNVYEERYKHKI